MLMRRLNAAYKWGFLGFREIRNFWRRSRRGGRGVEEVVGVDRLDPPVDAGIDTL
jgi:hypothetical protein